MASSWKKSTGEMTCLKDELIRVWKQLGKFFKYIPQFIHALWEAGDSDCDKRPPSLLFVFPLGFSESERHVPRLSSAYLQHSLLYFFSAKWEEVKLQILYSKSKDKTWIIFCYKPNSGCYIPIQSTNHCLFVVVFSRLFHLKLAHRVEL